MRHSAMGRSGLRLSLFGLGGWTTFGGSVTDDTDVRRILIAAFEAGINLFDTADVYARGECEKAMGKVLRELPRHELVVSSKVFWPMSDDVNDRGLSRKHVVESVDRSLARLGLDYLDIYFCHRFDPGTPIEETCRAMDDLIRAGKVHYWGTSEWTGDQLRLAHATCAARGFDAPRVEQPQYSLVARPRVELDVAPAARELGMGLMAWSPLASGLLTGKYDDGVPAGSRLDRNEWLREKRSEQLIDRVRTFREVADGLGCSRTQLALAWAAVHQDMSSVLLGATSPAQLEENLGALEIELTPQVLQRLDEIFPADVPAP